MNTEKKNRTFPGHSPVWFDGHNIHEHKFCEEFLRDFPMKSVNGTFFTVEGRIDDEEAIRKEIYERIKPCVLTGLSKKVGALLEVLRLQCWQSELPRHTDRIHTANGTFFIPTPDMNWFTPQKDYCCNRLPVDYNPEAPEPAVWLRFLSELLPEEDILTLQEFMGYCLLPTTRGQKMLLMIGKGGEGKSRIGVVLRSLLGNNMNVGSIQKVETNRFARADLEYRLLLLDDDMQMEALPSTTYLKSIITAEQPMDLEKKGKQSYQGELYVRFIGLGNGSLHALYDRSEGFFRRQILLRTKDKAPERNDDPFLAEKMTQEAEGILLWAIEGLRRLMRNNFRFTISERAQENLKESVRDGNNIMEFLDSAGYIRFREGAASSSRELYAVYKGWCDDNTVTPLAPRTFGGFMKDNLDRYGLRYDTNIPIGNGKRARGFRGIECARLGRFEED